MIPASSDSCVGEIPAGRCCKSNIRQPPAYKCRAACFTDPSRRTGQYQLPQSDLIIGFQAVEGNSIPNLAVYQNQ